MDRIDYITAIEKLNSEILSERSSKASKIGSAFLKYFDALSHFRLKRVARLLRDNRAARIIKKRYTKKIESHLTLPNDVDFQTKKLVIYTCVVGNYDQIPEPLLKFENVSYVAFVDSQKLLRKKDGCWTFLPLPNLRDFKSSILKNRYMKFHPNDFFQNYDYSIYIDGNIRVVSDIRPFIQFVSDKTGLAMHCHGRRDCVYDEANVCLLYGRGNSDKIKEQIRRYRSEGLPENFGLNEANVIVTDLKNNQSAFLLNEWWKEFFYSESLRDQLAWPYVLWKNGMRINDVGCLGVDVYSNAKLQIKRHN